MFSRKQIYYRLVSYLQSTYILMKCKQHGAKHTYSGDKMTRKALFQSVWHKVESCHNKLKTLTGRKLIFHREKKKTRKHFQKEASPTYKKEWGVEDK